MLGRVRQPTMIFQVRGNAFKTWTDSDGHLWLRDSLPNHIPQARIMTFGYDSAVAFGRSEMNVEDFALDLLTRLLWERQVPSEQSRPILFICHSLGGVVLKQSLVTASSVQDHYGAIMKNTFGIIFMGTPHRGSRVASQARHLARIINITSLSKTVRSDLLGVLSMSSKVLQNISQLSVPILKDISIVSFYEQKPLGPTLIVESVSAILGLPNERAIPMNTDHRKMAKVSPRNKHLFMPVWKAVSELAEEAMDGNAWQLKQLMDTIFSVDYKQSQLLPRPPHDGTTNWIFENSVFNSWAVAKEPSFLWLVGPPGVGKSVLTRHLVEEVLGVLRCAVIHHHHRLRVFVSSRPMPDLEKSIKSVYMIRMRSADVSPDISKYLRDNVSDFALRNESFAIATDYRLRNEIRDKIVERADGMFLYASIAWDDFKKGLLWNRHTVKEKIRQLDSAAPGINTLYDRMMGKVNPEIRPDMWAIFGAIATAERSLTEAELGIILSIQRSKDPFISSAHIYPFEGLSEIIEAHFPELVRVQEDGNLSFTHLSFKEYLFQYWSEKDPGWLHKARLSLAEACITYLGLRDLVEDIQISEYIRGIHTKYPFFEYAYDFHIYHLRYAVISHPLWRRYAELGCRDSIFAANWDSKTYPSPLVAVIKHFKSAASIERFASFGYDVNEPWRPDSQCTPLEYCFFNIEKSKIEELVLALLEVGADPNTGQNSHWGFETTFHLVIEMGLWRVYDKMINHPDISLTLQNHRGQTALHYMVRFGDVERLAEFLQRSGFDINAQDSRGDTALHLATTYCELDKLKLLLNVDGVRLNIQDNQGRTALTVASYWGLREAALALISYSRALPTPKENEMSGIICAAMQEDQDLTRLMLEKSSFRDLDCHLDMAGRTVLHHAAINDWPSIIEQILDSPSGRSILDNIDHSGSSATHQAATLGHTRCVKFFLERGASLRLQDRNGRTAAHAAADAGFKDTLALLLNFRDLDPSQRDHQGRNLVHWAASIDCVDIIETIIRKWPDVDLLRKDNTFQFPIDIARACECPNVGKFLQREMERQGADPWLFKTYRWDSMYRSPMVDFVEEDISAIYEQTHANVRLTAQRNRFQDWKDVHDQYPEHLWALVCRRYMEDIEDIKTDIAQADDAIHDMCLRCANPRLETLRRDICRVRNRLEPIISKINSDTNGSIPLRLKILRAEMGAIHASLDVIRLELGTGVKRDATLKDLDQLRSELDTLRSETKAKKIDVYKGREHLGNLVGGNLAEIRNQIHAWKRRS
ncbi:hypothetical protein FE257_004020 [Aspergillus nanangensis]|uniref:Nephrocystin 3-like N-terminal domain-containing protein n=1 Tax=Aspergillus nanangensis TaxID=2582783 RepID=A0AAD4GXG7_ASPNN|nr:hypothetical protein FE257_004020 [Aspergillus nanangensis]